jgi:hypothetical protein
MAIHGEAQDIESVRREITVRGADFNAAVVRAFVTVKVMRELLTQIRHIGNRAPSAYSFQGPFGTEKGRSGNPVLGFSALGGIMV